MAGFVEHIGKVVEHNAKLAEAWLTNDYKEVEAICKTLDVPDFTDKSLREPFDREELNNQYEEAFNSYKTEPNSSKNFAILQAEIDVLYSMSKSFVGRHRSRLKMYRDAVSQKKNRVRLALAVATANFEILKNRGNK